MPRDQFDSTPRASRPFDPDGDRLVARPRDRSDDRGDHDVRGERDGRPIDDVLADSPVAGSVFLDAERARPGAGRVVDDITEPPEESHYSTDFESSIWGTIADAADPGAGGPDDPYSVLSNLEHDARMLIVRAAQKLGGFVDGPVVVDDEDDNDNDNGDDDGDDGGDGGGGGGGGAVGGDTMSGLESELDVSFSTDAGAADAPVIVLIDQADAIGGTPPVEVASSGEGLDLFGDDGDIA